jgi:uncharacterized membrane protein YdbT with pleckstrin-like domain
MNPETAAQAAGVAAHTGAESELWQGHPSAKGMLGTILGAALLVVAVIVAAVLVFDPLMGLVGRASEDAAREVAQDRGTYATILGLVVAAVVVVRLTILTWQIIVLKSHHYRVTNQRIVIESGVFSKHIEEIDIRTVADIEFRQSFFERVLGVGDITLVGSDRSAACTRLRGLARPRELRELVREAAYKATKGQLFTRET